MHCSDKKCNCFRVIFCRINHLAIFLGRCRCCCSILCSWDVSFSHIVIWIFKRIAWYGGSTVIYQSNVNKYILHGHGQIGPPDRSTKKGRFLLLSYRIDKKNYSNQVTGWHRFLLLELSYFYVFWKLLCRAYFVYFYCYYCCCSPTINYIKFVEFHCCSIFLNFFFLIYSNIYMKRKKK